MQCQYNKKEWFYAKITQVNRIQLNVICFLSKMIVE